MSGTTNFASGARRSDDAKGMRFDLVCPTGVRRVAERCFLGAVVKGYGEGNWTKGMDVQDTINHIQRHLDLWKSGDRSDDHLGGAAWGLFAIMHFEECCTCFVGLEAMKEIDRSYQELRAGLAAAKHLPKVRALHLGSPDKTKRRKSGRK